MTRPLRSDLLAQRLLGGKKPVERPGDSGELNRRISEGKVIPILGNSIRSERIFQLNSDFQQSASAEPAGAGSPAPSAAADPTTAVESGPVQTVTEILASVWANDIGYPMHDTQDLARVAQYNRVKSKDAEEAKIRFLLFLKDALLRFAEADDRLTDVVSELRRQVNRLSFTDIAQELDFPYYPDPQQDPLRLLSKLPLKIYVTTTPFDFLERALKAENRRPRTQVCFWNGETVNVDPEHETDLDFQPTAAEPLVYHLFGLEKYPSTMVVSEDDYLDFLVRIAQDNDPKKQVVPLYLREALAESSLILLGYRMQDWEFRVLFRGIIKQSSLRLFSLVLQLRPEDQVGIVNKDEARNYLEDYFGPAMFTVKWGDAEQFVQELWNQWDRWRQ